MPNDKKTTPPRFKDLDKHNIQELEEKIQTELDSINQLEDNEPQHMPRGNWKERSLEVNREVLEFEKQKILRGIKEIKAEIARQKETTKLAKQFNKKLREDKEREKKDRGH